MGFIDIVLGALLAFGFYKGCKNGFFIELASLISFVLGIYAAIKFSCLVSSFLGKHVSWSPKTIQVTAFVMTLLLVIVALHLLAKMLTGVASAAFVGWANTLAGGFFATVKMALLIGIVLSLFQKVNVNNMLVSKETQQGSLFFNPCIKTAEIVLPVLTDWFEDLKAKAVENNKDSGKQ